jgi:excisionase family DNA binding protein
METQKSMLTTEDVANYLKVDVVTVRRLISRGELAAYRVGGEFRFTVADLQDYLKRQYMPVEGEPQPGKTADPMLGQYVLLRQIFAPWGKGRRQGARAMGERFTERARAALEQAQVAAEQQRCGHIYASHLLLGLAADQASLAGRALNILGLTAEAIREVLASHDELTGPARDSTDRLDIDAGVKRALEAAVQQAKKHSHDYVGPEHLLLGLLSDPKGKAIAVLNLLKARPDALRSKVHELMRQAEK